MDSSQDKTRAAEEGAYIRLRYTTQFNSGGRTHSIETEIPLPLGASQEVREQIIREAELGLEHLARQITRRNTRSQSQTPGPGTSEVPSVPAASRSASPTRPQSDPAALSISQRPASAATPTVYTPVSESMPTTPSVSGEGGIRLPQFINAIKKHWNMSPQRAMELLNVKSLDGINYREAYNRLKVLVEQDQMSNPGPQARARRPAPVVEAPRQPNHDAPPTASSRLPIRSATPPAKTSGVPAQGQSAHQAPARSISQATQITTEPSRSAPSMETAVLPKAPIPIIPGNVRDISNHTYRFEEEDDEEEFVDAANRSVPGSAGQRLVAQMKLDALKEIRGNQAASAERLKVLDNLLSSQISEEQLQQILQTAWGITGKKKLKTGQVEALISWAKEDFFMEEVDAMLALLLEKEM